MYIHTYMYEDLHVSRNIIEIYKSVKAQSGW